MNKLHSFEGEGNVPTSNFNWAGKGGGGVGEASFATAVEGRRMRRREVGVGQQPRRVATAL